MLSNNPLDDFIGMVIIPTILLIVILRLLG